jgi:hypothetical protein
MEHSNRQLYINNITEQLNKLERSQKKDKEAVSFLEKSADYQTKKAQVKEDIKNREQDILKLQEQLQNISSGSLDIEINKEQEQKQRSIKEKGDATTKRKTDAKAEKEAKLKVFFKPHKKNYYHEEPKNRENNYGGNNGGNSENRQNNKLNKDITYHYKRFCKVTQELPDYIKKNLDEMPNNKGYIWRDCWFMGKKNPERNQPHIMFEKMKGGILHIHEYTEREYKLYEKVGKQSRKLLSSKLRKKRF